MFVFGFGFQATPSHSVAISSPNESHDLYPSLCNNLSAPAQFSHSGNQEGLCHMKLQELIIRVSRSIMFPILSYNQGVKVNIVYRLAWLKSTYQCLGSHAQCSQQWERE